MMRKKDPEWEAKALAIMSGEVAAWTYPDLSHMSFSEFTWLYGGLKFAPHQMEIEKALLDPMAKVVLILGHPESGKSTLVSLWYVLYRLALNPDLRCAIVTKNSTKAQDLLNRIKRYLTEDHLYAETERNFIKDFGGWKPEHGDMQWSQDQIMVKHRQSGERDPTIQALGIGKHIYGARLDLLILDDALVMDNQISEVTRERLDTWFDGEARSRAQRGQVVVNGTRLLPQDLYGAWKKQWAGQRLFRQVVIPAILNEWTEEEKVSWEGYWTLDGYDIMEEINGEDIVTGFQMGMRDLRDLIVRKDPNRWKLIYQQEDVELEQAIFHQRHIDSAFELGAHRSRYQVMEHERLILAVDPATTGRAASIVLAVDPITQVRTVVDLFVGSNLGATGIRRKLLYDFWERYGVEGKIFDVTVIEENFVKTLRGDESLMAKAMEAGTNIAWPHTLGKGRTGKWDEEFGIAAMAGLFGSGLISFANGGSEGRKWLDPLVDDMMVFPWSKIQDAVIALWLAVNQAKNLNMPAPRQEESMNRRGVPPVVRRNWRRR